MTNGQNTIALRVDGKDVIAHPWGDGTLAFDILGVELERDRGKIDARVVLLGEPSRHLNYAGFLWRQGTAAFTANPALHAAVDIEELLSIAGTAREFLEMAHPEYLLRIWANELRKRARHEAHEAAYYQRMAREAGERSDNFANEAQRLEDRLTSGRNVTTMKGAE